MWNGLKFSPHLLSSSSCQIWKAWLCYGWLHEETQRAKPFNLIQGLLHWLTKLNFERHNTKTLYESHVQNRIQIKSVNLDKLFLQRTQRTPIYSQLSWRPLRPALNLRRAATVRNTGLKRNTTREIISVCICMYTYIRRLSLLLVKTVCPAKYFCNQSLQGFPT